MARYTFFTQAARDASNVAASSEELVNCYPEVAPGDGRTRVNVRPVLGETFFAAINTPQIRAVEQVGDDLYAVAGAALFRITSGGVITNLGAVATGPDATIRGNGTFVTLAANGTYYVLSGGSLLTPGSGAFTDVGSVEFSSYDTILTEKDGRRFEWTDTADPTTRDALNFATAEQRDGNLLRAIADGGQLFLFGEKSVEIWRNTGASGANSPNRYAYLTVRDKGLKGYHLVVRGKDTGIFFIGNDDVAHMTSGTGLMPVSTPAVNTDLKDGTPISCGYYEDRGHKFFVVMFSDRPAWVYDFSTQIWHRRMSGVADGDWTARRIVEAWGAFYTVADSGVIRALGDSFADDGIPLARRMRGKPIDLDGRKFSVSMFEFLASVGTANLGREAKALLRVSGDGGLTWSDPIEGTLGDLGQYETQCQFPALGRYEQFTPEITVTDPAEIVMYSDARIDLR